MSTADKITALIALGQTAAPKQLPTSAGFNWWGGTLSARRWKKKCRIRKIAARSRTVNRLKKKGKRYGPTT